VIAIGEVRAPGALEILDRLQPSPSLNQHAVSVGGWLFDAREFGAESCPAGLDAIVAALSAASARCAALGSSYLPVLIPAKRNLINVTASSDRGWVAELNARLRDVDDVELMQLFGVLRHADRHGPPYHRTDADWNDLGAFFVARALLKEIHKRVPALTPPPLAVLHLRPLVGYRGALADVPKLELRDGELVSSEADAPAEDGLEIDASRLQALRMPAETHLAQAGASHVRVYAIPERADAPSIAVVGDSAALPVVLWLAERTGRTTFFSSQALPFAQLELESPRVVIHLMRETDLLSWALP
jgi:hypothetical protein